jgi:carboxylesterase
VGGCLALRLAQEHGAGPDGIAGVMVVNVAVQADDWRQAALLPWLRFLVPSFPGVVNDIKRTGQDEVGYDRLPLQSTFSLTRLWAATVARLPEVTQPLFVAHSPDDHLIPATSTRTVLGSVSSTDVTELVLSDSYHVATLDHDAPLLFDRSAEFVARVAVGAPA